MVNIGACSDFRRTYSNLWDNQGLFTHLRIPFAIVTLIVLAGCSGFGGGKPQDEFGQTFNIDQVATQEELPKFSTQTPQEGMPSGWSFYRIAPNKKNTVYRLENYQGRTVLSANSKTSASGLAVKLRPKSAQNLWLKWEWKATGPIITADNTDRVHDDSP